MAAVRVFAFLLLVAFSVQLVIAGVTRRDTGSEVVEGVQRALANAQSQMEELLNRNVSEILSDFSSQVQSIGTRINEVAQSVSEQLANSVAAATAAPATR